MIASPSLRLPKVRTRQVAANETAPPPLRPERLPSQPPRARTERWEHQLPLAGSRHCAADADGQLHRPCPPRTTCWRSWIGLVTAKPAAPARPCVGRGFVSSCRALQAALADRSPALERLLRSVRFQSASARPALAHD